MTFLVLFISFILLIFVHFWYRKKKIAMEFFYIFALFATTNPTICSVIFSLTPPPPPDIIPIKVVYTPRAYIPDSRELGVYIWRGVYLELLLRWYNCITNCTFGITKYKYYLFIHHHHLMLFYVSCVCAWSQGWR